MTSASHIASTNDIDSAKAWRVAIAASVVISISFGTVYSFGAFFDAMTDEFDTGLGSTSIVFAITAFLFFGTGAATGFLADKWGPRPLVIVGGTMFVAGLYATSHATAIWHGYLTYGLGVGLGAGLFVSSVFVMAAGWFDRYRGIAQGIVAAGSGLGTLILTPLSERLIDTQGWRQAFVVLSIIAAIAFAVSSVFLARPPVEAPAKAGEHLRTVLATPAFRRFGVFHALQSGTMLAAFAFTVTFATDEGVSSRTAALVVGVIGAASVVGRLFLSGLANRIGPVRLLQVAYAVQPFAFAIWATSGGNETVLFVYALVLGVAYGGYIGVIGLVAAHLFGVRGIGAVMGWIFLASGVGSLIAPPAIGYIADESTNQIVPKLVVVAISAAGAFVARGLQRGPVTIGN